MTLPGAKRCVFAKDRHAFSSLIVTAWLGTGWSYSSFTPDSDNPVKVTPGPGCELVVKRYFRLYGNTDVPKERMFAFFENKRCHFKWNLVEQRRCGVWAFIYIVNGLELYGCLYFHLEAKIQIHQITNSEKTIGRKRAWTRHMLTSSAVRELETD